MLAGKIWGGDANPFNRSAIYVKGSTTLTATGNEISLIAEGVAGKDIVGLKAESQSSVGITTVGDLSISAKNIDPKSSKKARVCNFLWAARSRLIDVGGDSVTK